MPSKRTDKEPGAARRKGRADTRRPRRGRGDPLAYRSRRSVEEGVPVARRRGNRRRIPLVVRANRLLRRLRNVLFVLLLVELVAVAVSTPRLAVRTVEVHGSSQRTPAAIARLAHLDKRMNVLTARVGEGEAKIAALPEVGSVDIYRVFPGTLVVNVTERVPLATVITHGGLWAVDGTGVVIRPLKTPMAGLPLLRVAASAAPKPGKPLPLNTLRPTLAAVRAMGGAPLPRSSTLVVDRKNGATVLSPDGIKVRLGPVDDAPQRLATLTRILNGGDGGRIRKEAAVIDLATPLGEVMVRRQPDTGEKER